MTRHTPRLAIAALLALAAGSAGAVQFPVTGSITVNGTAYALPNGSFGDSVYDPLSGILGAGRFTFPQSSIQVPIDGVGMATVTYQLSQADPAGALVASDGVAAMEPVAMTLAILWIAVPVPIGTDPCHFTPIDLDLSGSGGPGGLELEDRAFTVPPTTDACGGFASQINAALAGNSNSITLQLAGDFTPPAGDPDKIFVDGFDP